MKTPTFLKVNEPGVVFETIDGETILLNLDSGSFFNLEGSGEILWKFILETGNVKKAIAIMTSANRKIRATIASSVNDFVNSLLKEKLVIASDEIAAPGSLPETEELLKASAIQFSTPKVNKYTDKQHILFLSASYYIQEKGWPESIENTGLIGV
jgi:hypothetical protein